MNCHPPSALWLPFAKHVTAITNLELKNAYPGTHATSNSAFLSCAKAKRTESTDYYLGTTVDQIAASQMGQQDTACLRWKCPWT